MQRMFYYAELNKDKVCTGFRESTIKLVEHDYLIKLVDENKSLLYKKWDPVTRWSEETYEPSVDSELQDRINNLEEIITNQNIEIETLSNDNSLLNSRVVELEELLASYIGGAI